MGENFSMTAPPPRHSPSKAPRLSSARPSLLRTACILCAQSAALIAQDLHRFIRDFRADVQGRTKTDRALARLQDENASVIEILPELVPLRRVRQIKGDKQTATTNRG